MLAIKELWFNIVDGQGFYIKILGSQDHTVGSQCPAIGAHMGAYILKAFCVKYRNFVYTNLPAPTASE